ncbi:DUF4173 domain-containing protein [Rhizobium tropici]|uniref:DUF4173 domain-containing protein n=1 Tax=Rhizobium tropici TaxID=398 RepID=A0A5B0VZY2_RHITR|nr:DUF4173 domain-containing protein [Rhizobium tropici]KAA1180044.1 DUF4173 domain-containing protein [Rhizobium tropici]
MSLSGASTLPANSASNSNRKFLILLVLLVFADFFLFGKKPGLNLFLFANIVGTALLIRPPKSLSLHKAAGLLLLSLAASMPLIETTSWMGVAVCLLALACVSLGASRLFPRQWTHLPLVLLRFLLDVPARPFRRASYRWLQHLQKPSSQGVRHHLRGWIMPLGFAAGFLALFAMANPLIDKTLRNIDLTFLLQLLNLWHIGFWLVVAAFVSLLLYPRLAPRRPHRREMPDIVTGAEDGLFGHGALLRSLLVFNALFAVQTLLDLTYLWGGASLPDGMSHAEYAHRGAYPLMVTAILAAIFVLVAMRRGGPGDRSALLRTLVHLWIAQNILLCLSSIRRLDLYVEIYSLTELRVAAGIWMGLVAIGLFLIFLRILFHRSNEWLIALSSAMLGITLYAAAFTDIPAFIARFNVAHSREISGEGMVLDLNYLAALGPAAIPALDTYLASLPADSEQTMAVRRVRDVLRWQHEGRSLDWRSWTYRSARLDDYLKNHAVLAR